MWLYSHVIVFPCGECTSFLFSSLICCCFFRSSTLIYLHNTVYGVNTIRHTNNQCVPSDKPFTNIVWKTSESNIVVLIEWPHNALLRNGHGNTFDHFFFTVTDVSHSIIITTLFNSMSIFDKKRYVYTVTCFQKIMCK